MAGLRAQGQDQLADMLSGMHVTPGAGVDFAAIGAILGTLAVVYLLSAVFGWVQQYLMAGVVQRTIFRLREEVDGKLARLPLRYFDGHPRGDLLSRVTNDIDNISTTLQQSLTQLDHVGAHHRRRAGHDAHDQPAPAADLPASRCPWRSS